MPDKNIHAPQGATRGYGFLEKILAKKRADIANGLISPDYRSGRILDIGCGNYPLFLGCTAFAEKFAIDKISHNSVVSKWPENKRIKFLEADIEEKTVLPFDEGFFDTVTMLAVFEHVKPEALPLLIPEIYRVLKRGGIFIMTTPLAWTTLILKIMSGAGLVSKTEIEDHKRLYCLKEILSMLNMGGFDRRGIRQGFFEMFMNSWVAAKK